MSGCRKEKTMAALTIALSFSGPTSRNPYWTHSRPFCKILVPFVGLWLLRDGGSVSMSIAKSFSCTCGKPLAWPMPYIAFPGICLPVPTPRIPRDGDELKGTAPWMGCISSTAGNIPWRRPLADARPSGTNLHGNSEPLLLHHRHPGIQASCW